MTLFLNLIFLISTLEREKLSASLTRSENEKNRLEIRLTSNLTDGKRGGASSFLPVRSGRPTTNTSTVSVNLLNVETLFKI